MKKFRIKYNAPVILTFTLLCLAVLIISELTGYRFASQYFVTHRGSFSDPLTWLTMFTYVLGHSSITHFVGNIMLLLLVGPVVEEHYGSLNTLIVILATALITALANMAVGTDGLIGCSGIVFAFVILCSMTSFRKNEIPLTMILVAVLYIGQEIFNGITLDDNVSQMAHIIGGISGAAFGYFLNTTKQ